MSISFNLDQPAKHLAKEGYVYTWRGRQRPTGRQILFVKKRRMGYAQVERICSYERFTGREKYASMSGYPSWPEWMQAAEDAHKCGITVLYLYKATVDEDTRKAIFQILYME